MQSSSVDWYLVRCATFYILCRRRNRILFRVNFLPCRKCSMFLHIIFLLSHYSEKLHVMVVFFRYLYSILSSVLMWWFVYLNSPLFKRSTLSNQTSNYDSVNLNVMVVSFQISVCTCIKSYSLLLSSWFCYCISMVLIKAPAVLGDSGLLTPLTFAWHRLSSLAAFISGAYFLHNGRRWQWICEFYTANVNVKGIFWGT